MHDNAAEIHALKSRARALLSHNQLAQARGLYERICHLDRNDADSWFMLGAIYGSLGRFSEAIDCCRKVLASRPDHADAHYNLAQACMHLRRIEEAAAHFRETVRINPGNADAWNNLGLALHDLQRNDEARVCYQEALRLRPDLKGTEFLLAALGGVPAPDKPPPEYVEKLFDSFAARFDEHLVGHLHYRTPELLNRLIRRFMTASPDPIDILDLGCGTGLCGPLLRDMARTLVGVDLSSRMIERAREKKVYDQLHVGNITNPELDLKRRFDLVIAADVFPYLGDLSQVFAVCRGILKPDGCFAFSVERLDEESSYVLRATDRYAHAPAYVRNLVSDSGFTELGMEQVVLRRDRGAPVYGCIFMTRKNVA